MNCWPSFNKTWGLTIFPNMMIDLCWSIAHCLFPLRSISCSNKMADWGQECYLWLESPHTEFCCTVTMRLLFFQHILLLKYYVEPYESDVFVSQNKEVEHQFFSYDSNQYKKNFFKGLFCHVLLAQSKIILNSLLLFLFPAGLFVFLIVWKWFLWFSSMFLDYFA